MRMGGIFHGINQSVAEPHICAFITLYPSTESHCRSCRVCVWSIRSTLQYDPIIVYELPLRREPAKKNGVLPGGEDGVRPSNGVMPSEEPRARRACPKWPGTVKSSPQFENIDNIQVWQFNWYKSVLTISWVYWFVFDPIDLGPKVILISVPMDLIHLLFSNDIFRFISRIAVSGQ